MRASWFRSWPSWFVSFHSPLIFCVFVRSRHGNFGFLGHSDLSVIQHVREYITRQAFNQWIYDPCQEDRNRARQRDRFVLQVDATVFLLQAPVAVEAPHVTVVARFFVLTRIGSVRVGNFGDVRGM